MPASTPTIPEGLEMLSGADGIVIRKTWLTWKIAPLALFAIVWDGFLFFWYSQLLSKPNSPLVAVLFPIGHIAVGLGLSYYVVASLVNKTDIVISSSGVRATTGPAPWVGNKDVKFEEITEVIVRARASTNQRSTTYTVMYADPSRKERKLVALLPQSDQADFVARMIRDTFGLKASEA